jgi:hypothetical protein
MTTPISIKAVLKITLRAQTLPVTTAAGRIGIAFLHRCLRHGYARGLRWARMWGDGMLERLLGHLRYAVSLKECSAQARNPIERQLFICLASLHEVRARKLMQQVRNGHQSNLASRKSRIEDFKGGTSVRAASARVMHRRAGG